MTKKGVEMAKKKAVFVEAELGRLKGIEVFNLSVLFKPSSDFLSPLLDSLVMVGITLFEMF